MPEIRLEHVTKRWGKFYAVDDLSMVIQDNAFVTLLGPSGCGKTTTLRMISGLASPTAGEIELFGCRGRKLSRIRSRVGCLTEGPGLYGNMCARDNLKMKCMLLGVYKKGYEEELLDIVGLGGVGKKPVKRYSLGMKQRLAIALAVMHNPELLILDEPINGLDPIGIAEMRDFIRELCDAMDKTILISSHILSEISLLADDIGIIDHGVLLEEESLARLEQKNGRYLRFLVSNAPIAARLLQDRLGIRALTVENGQELTVQESSLNAGEAVRLFVEAGLEVSEAHLCEDTLEDYFKKITGGEGIA